MATDVILGEATVQELREGVRGEVIQPGDPGYEDARLIWNGMIDRHPALIVRCAGVSDVLRALDFGRSQDLPIAVRGGGHSIPGFSTVDGGLVIDLSPMKGLLVDRGRRRAVAQAGLTWAEFDHETQAFGLAVTGGLVSTTGIAGFTLGGGIGWLMRKHGLTADNLVSADMVTADGEMVHASAEENPELFWGLRGGGGNFGIVTSFEYDLHPVGPTILGGPIFYRGEDARAVLDFYREWSAQLPDEVTSLVNLLTAPPAPFLPEEVHGKPIVAIVAAHSGSVEDGERAVRELRAFGSPIVDLMGPMPYVALQTLIDDLYPKGLHNYFKSGYLGGMSDGALDTIMDAYGRISSPLSEIHIQHLGGAIARVPEDATAFGERGAPYVLNLVTRWQDRAEEDTHIAWARGLYDAMTPHLTGGVYVNFLSAEGEERVHQAYGPDKYARLVALKDRWDPDNVFQLNQNIKPSGAR